MTKSTLTEEDFSMAQYQIGKSLVSLKKGVKIIYSGSTMPSYIYEHIMSSLELISMATLSVTIYFDEEEETSNE